MDDKIFEYWTFDAHKQVRLRKYRTFKLAMRKAEWLNQEYGAVRYSVEIDGVKPLDWIKKVVDK
jgi:hypothetical protein